MAALAAPATPPRAAPRLLVRRSSSLGSVTEEPPHAGPPPQSSYDLCRTSEQPPMRSFQCPITHEVMRDPVMAADGHSYERAAITRWIGRAVPGAPTRSPCTNMPLAHARLTPNHSLRAAIVEWCAAAGAR